MNRTRYILIALIFFILHQDLTALNCSVDIAQFKYQEDAYVDVILRVDATTCTFNEAKNGSLSNKLFVQILIQQGQYIKGVEKYYLNTTDIQERKDIMDLRRFVLKDGLYDVDIMIKDELDSLNVFQYKSRLIVHSPNDFKLSDAIIASKITPQEQESPLCRNNICIEPLPYLLINEYQPTISLYQEVYNKSFRQNVLVHKTTINKISEDSIYINQPITKFKKVKGDEIGVIVNTIDVSKLTSGEYELTTSIIDKTKKELFSKSLRLIVTNRIADLASVRDYNSAVENSFVQGMDSASVSYALRAISPISSSIDQPVLNYAARKAPIEVMRYYLFKFWDDAYPGVAESAYNKYMEVARAVDGDFASNVGFGFETDRGYIYLKYGAPSKTINVIDEPNTPPYEIWFYNSIDFAQQTDVRFLFYDPLQVNNFELLHSTAYGERSNPSWEGKLYKFGGATEGFGTRAKRLFDEF